MSSSDDIDSLPICPSCNKPISGNYRLHCLMCERLKLCPICQERVQDLDEHNKEYHQKIVCDMCNQEVDEYLFEKHQAEECPRRVVGHCPYCEIDLFPDNKEGLTIFFKDIFFYAI